MKTSNDIERLRTAEADARKLIEEAHQEVQHIRREASARAEEMNAQNERDIGSLRERIQVETEQQVDTIAQRSREQVVAVHRAITARLDANKTAAVQQVIEELTNVS